MDNERPVFMSRDYGDRAVPPEAVVIFDGGADEDATVWGWLDEDTPMLQQGYDLISLPDAAVERLIALRAAEGIHAPVGHYAELEAAAREYIDAWDRNDPIPLPYTRIKNAVAALGQPEAHAPVGAGEDSSRLAALIEEAIGHADKVLMLSQTDGEPADSGRIYDHASDAIEALQDALVALMQSESTAPRATRESSRLAERLRGLEEQARAYETAIHAPSLDVDAVNAAQRALDESRHAALRALGMQQAPEADPTPAPPVTCTHVVGGTPGDSGGTLSLCGMPLPCPDHAAPSQEVE